jgi:ribosomal protein S18 acetylase RimI-like enzyme
MKITLRPLQIQDYESLVALWEKAGLPFKPRGRDRRENIARELHAPTAIFLVAESDGRLVGSILGTHDGRKGWINRLAVDPAYRRQGIGRRLVEAVEQRLEQLGIEIVACLIEDWNKDSLAAFQAMGYVKHDDIYYFSKRKSPEV